MTPQEEAVAKAMLQYRQPGGFGPRYGNPTQQKGLGFYGPLLTPSGDYATELSGEDESGEFPLLYQGMSREDMDDVLHGGGRLTLGIYRRAADAARQRRGQGLSPFAGEGEQSPPAWSFDWWQTKP